MNLGWPGVALGRTQPLDVPCPFCGAPPDYACWDESNKPVATHELRVARAADVRAQAMPGLEKDCERCGALAGQRCVTPKGALTFSHRVRLPPKPTKGRLGQGR